MKIHPTKNRLLILSDPEPELLTPGGVHVPAVEYLNHPNKGSVLATGPDCIDVRVGDRVIYNTAAPQMRIPYGDDQSLILIRERPVPPDPMQTLAGFEVEQ
jgi:co-chaperonin GroES (HSP10)